MAGRGGSIVTERKYWVLLTGLTALVFWVVTIGVGWRAWLITRSDLGIVAHVQAFGRDALPWMVTAAVLTMTTALLGVGLAVVRRLADAPGARALPQLGPKEPVERLPAIADARSSADDDELVAAVPTPDASEGEDAQPDGVETGRP